MKKKDVKEIIYLNKKNVINSDKCFFQEFFNKLCYYNFGDNIKFIRGEDDENISLKQNEDYRKETEIDNFINTNILELDNNLIEQLNNNKNKNNNNPTSHKYRNIFNKYIKLNGIVHYDCLIQYFFIKNKLPNYIDKLRDDLDSEVEYNESDLQDNNDIENEYILKQINKRRENELIYKNLIKFIDNDKDDLIEYYTKKYENEINTYNHIELYKYPNYNNSIINKFTQLKRLIRLLTNDKKDENKLNDINEEIKEKKDKLISTLLLFLKINLLEDYNKKIVKRFIFDNSNFVLLTGFSNNIINYTNLIKDDNGVEHSFLLWIETILLEDYNNYNHFKIKKKKLNPHSDFALIKKIINFYLNDINLKFDYEYQDYNCEKPRKSLQFTIIKQYDIKISNIPNINPYYFKNKMINTNNTEQYLINYNDIKNIKPKIIIEQKYLNIRQTLYINNDNIIGNINNNITLKPISDIEERYILQKRDGKRSIKVIKYYDKNENELQKEIYNHYDNGNKIKKDRFFYNKNNDKIRLVDNYIERQTKIKAKKQKDLNYLSDYIFKTNDDNNNLNNILNNMIDKVIKNNELEYILKNEEQSLNQLNKKINVNNEIENSIIKPILITNIEEYEFKLAKEISCY